MTVTFKNTEFTKGTFINEDGERVNGIKIHMANDNFHDSDCVGAVDCELPTDEDNAETLLINEYWEQHYKIVDPFEEV